ncbi:MAG: gliding motility-associated C-terminal domain-containing protein [Taibaiella sp.]|jgi:gliding motility-associated-like protein
MKKALGFTFFFILSCLASSSIQAQLPTCNGNNGLIYFLVQQGPMPAGIYNWDPTQPFSATNPVLNTIPLPNPYSSFLTVGDNLSGSGPSPTFYTSVNGIYYYYNGSTWVNTGHSSGPDNVGAGAGGGYIYSYDAGASGKVYKYDGTGDATLLMTVPNYGFWGANDLAADCEGNFYTLNYVDFMGYTAPSDSIGWLRKYSPTGTLLQEWSTTGAYFTGTASFNLAVLNGEVYFSIVGTMYKGIIGPTTVTFSPLPGGIWGTIPLSPHISDFASCPLSVGAPVAPQNDTLYNCIAGAPLTVTASGNTPYSCTVINGTATITGNGPTFDVSNTLPATVVLKSRSGCSTISDTFLIIPAPTVYAGPDYTIYGCPLATDTLHTTLTNATSWVNYNFNWTPVTTIISGANTPAPVITPTTNTNYTVTVTTDAAQGNCTFSDDVSVTVSDESVTAGFSFDIKPGCNEDIVTFTNTSANHTINLWDFGDGAGSTDVNPVHQYIAKGMRKVMLTVSNSYCTDSMIQWADIGQGNTWMRVPNAFSPNNDGLNDKFGPVLNDRPQQYIMRIFNRWGEEVYVSYEEAQPWDGTHNGQLVDAGTYYYTIEGECSVGGQKFREKGEVILIR